MSSASPTADLLIQLIDEVQRFRGRLKTAIDRFHDPEGPVGLAMTVLTAVVCAPHPPTVPQIGRSLGYPRQTVQRQADELVERGLIAFVDNPDHKRARRLIATGAGTAAHGRSNARSMVWAAEFTRGIDPERLAAAVATLHMIRTRIEDEARQAPEYALETNDQDKEQADVGFLDRA
jgi:DNA-binding MarR family transcriptional regulator